MNVNQMRDMIKEFQSMSLKKERIRTSLEKELHLNPDNTQSYVKLGLYYLSVEDLPESLKNFKKATLQKPGNENFWFIQGYIYESSKSYMNALEAYYFSYRLGSSIARDKLLKFSNSEMASKLGPKEKKIIQSFKESIC